MTSRPFVRAVVAGVLFAGFLGFVASCQKKSEQTSSGETTGVASTPVQPSALDQGQGDFVAYCAMCHGIWGDGDGPLAAQLRTIGGAAPAHLNQRARLDSLGLAEITRVIEKGGAHTGRSNLMPPWGENMPRSSIHGIAAFVMTLPDAKRTLDVTMQQYLAAPPGSAGEGRALYAQYCVPCHGPHGKGDGVYADTLAARNNIRPRDLTDSTYFAKRTDPELFTLITLGGAHAGKSAFMPIWAVTIPPGQIRDLVSYVRSISRTQPQP